MRINMIVAMSKDGVIGKDNKLPWNIPEETLHFKKITEGNIVIMGRKTYDIIREDLGQMLPDRHNIVISRNKQQGEGITFVDNIDDSLLYAGNIRKGSGKDIYIIGGSEIFNQTIDRADRLLISYIKGDYRGDSFFPVLKPYSWPIGYVKDHGSFFFTVRNHWRTNLLSRG